MPPLQLPLTQEFSVFINRQRMSSIPMIVRRVELIGINSLGMADLVVLFENASSGSVFTDQFPVSLSSLKSMKVLSDQDENLLAKESAYRTRSRLDTLNSVTMDYINNTTSAPAITTTTTSNIPYYTYGIDYGIKENSIMTVWEDEWQKNQKSILEQQKQALMKELMEAKYQQQIANLEREAKEMQRMAYLDPWNQSQTPRKSERVSPLSHETAPLRKIEI